jgi:periplasmic protein TonB
VTSGAPNLSLRWRVQTTPPWTLGSVLGAAALTAGTFMLIPYLEVFARLQPDLEVTPAFQTVRPPPPPPLPPAFAGSRTPDRPDLRTVPKPTLVEPRQRPAVNAIPDFDVSLDLAQGNVRAGQFDLNFPVAREDLVEQIRNIPFELADLDQPPQPLVQMHPVYPPKARASRVEGSVTLEFIVAADGSAHDVTVVSASPPDVFEKVTTRAVQGWRFSPGTKDGKPVPVRVRQTIKFQLE